MRQYVDKLVDGTHLSEDESRHLLGLLTEPELDELLATAALVALRVKGETADELRGFARGLQELALRPDIPPDAQAVDVVGTGGDGSGSLNLSTGSALLSAAAGVPIIKHGNRSVSSQSGSADVLAALGMEMPLDARRAGELFARTGFSFLFAPAYHPAMKSIAPVRKALAVRTIFNLAGPLANPAAPPFGVVGAYSVDLAEMMAETLSGMEIERAFVIHGAPGWDEVTPVGEYHLFEVVPGSVRRTIEDPADFGIDRCSPDQLAGADAAYNAARIREVFDGEHGPHRDALVLGASLALRVTGSDAAEAMGLASAAIDDGRAGRMLASLSEGVHV